MSKEFFGRTHKELATHWRNTENRWQNTVLMAARLMAREGFGISTGQPINRRGDLIDDLGQIAIYTETQHDKKSLEKLIQSDEFRLLPVAPPAVPNSDSLDWALKTEDLIRQIIRDKELKPKVRFIDKLKRKFGRK